MLKQNLFKLTALLTDICFENSHTIVMNKLIKSWQIVEKYLNF